MTNEETIEKLNDGLVQLIDAYETLQLQKQELEEELAKEKEKNKELEFKLSDFNSTSEVQASKMDSMLGKIKRLLDSPISTSNSDKEETSIEEEPESFNDNSFENSIDSSELKLDFDNHSDEEDKKEDSLLDIKIEEDEEKPFESHKKVDLGRMEKLLNGLNNR